MLQMAMDGSWRPGPPDVQRGDWVRQRSQRSRIRLRFYDLPFPAGNPIPCGDWSRAGGQFLGPVHAVDHGIEFLAVQVPHPTTGELAWVNIFNHQTPARYAWVVPDEELAEWFRRGFRIAFLNMLRPSAEASGLRMK